MIEMQQRPRTIPRQRVATPTEGQRSRLSLTALEADGLRRYLGVLISRATESLTDDAHNFVDAGDYASEKIAATRGKVQRDIAAVVHAAALLDGELGWHGPATLTCDDLVELIDGARDHALICMREYAAGGDWWGLESVQEAAIIVLADRLLGARDDVEQKVRVLIDGALTTVVA